jgi:hypothetical protein
MTRDFELAPTARRTPFKKANSDLTMMQTPTHSVGLHEVSKVAEWSDYSNEEAGMRSDEPHIHEDKPDGSWYTEMITQCLCFSSKTFILAMSSILAIPSCRIRITPVLFCIDLDSLHIEAWVCF